MTENAHLTSAEIGKLWATYVGNTMASCILKYYLHHVEDEEIKSVVNHALSLSESFSQSIKEIFIQENFPIPVGFTENDVNVAAPRLFEDEFYLHYLRYTSKAGMYIYNIATWLMTREDTRKFFTHAVQETTELMRELNRLMLKKNILPVSPPIPIPERVVFVKKQNYLNGYFGDVRPLHALEIAHLYDVLENDIASKGLILGFGQVAKEPEIRKFFMQGKDINQKHIELFSQKLYKEDLPSPSLIDHLVSTSTSSPFSDKLMLFHKIDMFSVKISAYAAAITVNGRHDLGVMYSRAMMDVGLYAQNGANKMIDRGWMEQVPEAVNRDNLISN
jgi:hypothetical protein